MTPTSPLELRDLAHADFRREFRTIATVGVIFGLFQTVGSLYIWHILQFSISFDAGTSNPEVFVGILGVVVAILIARSALLILDNSVTRTVEEGNLDNLLNIISRGMAVLAVLLATNSASSMFWPKTIGDSATPIVALANAVVALMCAGMAAAPVRLASGTLRILALTREMKVARDSLEQIRLAQTRKNAPRWRRTSVSTAIWIGGTLAPISISLVWNSPDSGATGVIPYEEVLAVFVLFSGLSAAMMALPRVSSPSTIAARAIRGKVGAGWIAAIASSPLWLQPVLVAVLTWTSRRELGLSSWTDADWIGALALSAMGAASLWRRFAFRPKGITSGQAIVAERQIREWLVSREQELSLIRARDQLVARTNSESLSREPSP